MTTITPPPVQPSPDYQGEPAQPPAPPQKRSRKLAVLTGIVALVAGAGIAGVVAGSHPAAAVHPAASHSAPPASSQPASAPASPAPSPSTPASLSGPLGTTYTDTGTYDATGAAFGYDVTAVRITDPAYGANEFDAPDPGFRFAGVEFKVTGVSGYSEDDVNVTASVIGTDGQVYTPVFDDISAGTNFSSGDFNVTAGQSETGWAAFELPAGVRIASVQWQPGIGSQPATWMNGS